MTNGYDPSCYVEEPGKCLIKRFQLVAFIIFLLLNEDIDGEENAIAFQIRVSTRKYTEFE